MSSTLQLISVLLLLILLFIWKRYRRLTLLQRYGIKGPVEHAKWLTGNALEMIECPPKKIEQWIKEYGKVFGMYDFSPVIVISDPDFLKQIQVRDFHLFPNRRVIIPAGGFDANPEYEVHITSTDIPSERWKEQRSLIATAFTTSKLKAAVPLISDAVDVLLQNIADRESEPDFEIYDLFQRFTMDTIGSSAFGISLNCQENPQNPMFIATKKFFDDFTKDWKQLLLYLTFMFPEFFLILYPIRRMQRKLMLWLGCPSHWTYQIEVCRQIVEQRKQRFHQMNSTQREDLLQQMIEASLTSDQMNSVRESNLAATDSTDDGLAFTTGHQVQHQSSKGKVHRMTDQEIIGNASILFDAGYETTSTLLGFLTHVLVNKHDIQDRIREEVNELYARDHQLDYNVMQSLPFLDSVIYETLRMSFHLLLKAFPLSLLPLSSRYVWYQVSIHLFWEL